MFVDHIKIHAKAGDGGSGSASFRREKFVPKGGPDGGDGGRGGDVILRADTHVDNLANFFYEPIIKAKCGGSGRGKQCSGKAAKPVVLAVPTGTLVYRAATAESRDAAEANNVRRSAGFYDLEKAFPDDPTPQQTTLDPSTEFELIADLTDPGQEFVLCKGGEGGKGNVHFKNSRNRAPREFTPGEDGGEGDFYLELRKIADAGLVGYPNAGKSTVLTKISAARSKIAAYPFTTLHPIIGVVDFPGDARATVADIPGLIEGAHLDIGLGHDFLRHIVRCKLLLFVLDMAGSEGRNPLDDLGTLRKELKLYDPALANKEWIVVANKMDLPSAVENLKAFKRRFPKRKVIAISAGEGTGLDELKKELRVRVHEPA